MAGKFSTTSEFIRKADIVHNKIYDYSMVSYSDSYTPITILCLIHGEFTQRPNDHLMGKGCRACGIAASAEKRTTSQKCFIEKSTKVHEGLYTYECVEYKKDRVKVVITCKKHGKFKQHPGDHLRGKGCNKCANEKRRVSNSNYITANQPTILYYFKHNPTGTYKLGITSVGYDKRYNKKLRDVQTLLWFSETMPREDAEELEEFIHNEFENSRMFNHHYKDNGGTEFFSYDILNKEKGK